MKDVQIATKFPQLLLITRDALMVTNLRATGNIAAKLLMRMKAAQLTTPSDAKMQPSYANRFQIINATMTVMMLA